jgi:hypothetical protein
MALGNELVDWPLVESAGDQQDYVVDHVGVTAKETLASHFLKDLRDVVEECGEWLDRIVAQMVELGHQLLLDPFIDHLCAYFVVVLQSNATCTVMLPGSLARKLP